MNFLTRALQWLLAIALVLAVMLWFAARRGDRGFIEEEVTIGRPAPAVFRWISSEDLTRRWISDLVELRRADGRASPQSATSFKMVQLIGGHRVEMNVRIVRVVPNQELALQISSGNFSSGGFSGDADFKLMGGGDYTRLIFTSHTRFASLADRICEPVLTFATQHKIKEDLAKLKLLLEAEPGNSPSLRAASVTPWM